MKKSIGIGFIGGGFITRFHIQSLIGVRNCEVLGVMSKTEASAEESASLARTIGVGQAKVFKTISEMVAHPDINALWICAPHYTRVEVMEVETKMSIFSFRRVSDCDRHRRYA